MEGYWNTHTKFQLFLIINFLKQRLRIFVCWSWSLIALAHALIALAHPLIALAHALIALAHTLIDLTHLIKTEKQHWLTGDPQQVKHTGQIN